MRKDILVFLLLAAGGALVFYKSFFNFFAQDDFILINHFSQNGFLTNLRNVFGAPTVTHWRPIHNLYFFVSDSLFGKNYFGYHLLTFIIHITGGFLIYKTMIKITRNRLTAICSAVFYLISPVHFVSLYWISGGATLIGFTFLIASFYFYLSKKFALSVGLFITSLLASEAMVIGAGIFLAWDFLESGKLRIGKPIILTGVVSAIFAFIQLVFLFPSAAVDAYKIEISPSILTALKYYLLRIPGFVEGTDLNILSGVLALWLLTVGVFTTHELMKKADKRIFIFAAFVIFIGLLPFVLIPNHLSPHYMNISLWGLAMLIGLTLAQTPKYVAYLLIMAIVVVNAFGVVTLQENSWVIKRSDLAKIYLTKIETDNPPPGTRLILGDNGISTSLDAYYALGTGEAIGFWFPEKNYNVCFTWYQQCLK
ncbi:MAG: hypothetical protein Q7S45_04460 [Candidatus Curtissbacteria bacterium]|nr:hypothetical protein [Candidatus Curtissbacteria bacterium]